MSQRTLMKFTQACLLRLGVLVILLGLITSVTLAATSTTSYIIRSGDTLASVARDHDVTLDELLALNPAITDPNGIYVGQTIQVPTEDKMPGTEAAICPQPYTTKAGDTWASVASTYNVEAGVLALVNNMALTQTLTAGKELCIPTVPATSTPMTTPIFARTPIPATPIPATPVPSPTTSPPPTRLPAPGEGPGQWYTIQRGDYLSRVAIRHSCTTRVVIEVNNIVNPSLIFAGRRIWIPANCTALIRFLPAIPRYVPPTPAPTRVAPPRPPAPAATPIPIPAAPPVQPPPTPITTSLSYTAHGPWTAQYFNNINLQGNAVVSRQDRQIVFQWGAGSPASGVRSDGFSARWTGRFFFTGAKYTFAALADDGVRVWVDNQLVLDGWKDQSQTLYFAEFTPRYGNHDVRVEYYDTRSDATVIVNWAPSR